VAGFDIGLDEEGLFADFDWEAPEHVQAGIREHRDDIAALARPGPDGFTGEAWWSLYFEFVAMVESVGEPPHVAERLAFDGVIGWWLGRNPVAQEPWRCCHCGGDHAILFAATGEWCHLQCLEAWQARRCADAVAALAEFSITAES